jgi:hypothetical protein
VDHAVRGEHVDGDDVRTVDGDATLGLDGDVLVVALVTAASGLDVAVRMRETAPRRTR